MLALCKAVPTQHLLTCFRHSLNIHSIVQQQTSIYKRTRYIKDGFFFIFFFKEKRKIEDNDDDDDDDNDDDDDDDEEEEEEERC